MPRVHTKRNNKWGTGTNKSLKRQQRDDDWRKKRNERKREN